MSYDVIVTETVGEFSKEYKFKDYRDFLDWELQGKAVNKDCTELLTKKELPEIEEELIRLTRGNVLLEVEEGDTVVIKDYNKGNSDYGDYPDIDIPIKVLEVESLSYMGDLCIGLCNGFDWIDFSDDQLEIYKVIKN